jgi:hypothetical protein
MTRAILAKHDEEDTPAPVFPAKAGIQTLSHRLFVRGAPSSFDRLRMRNEGLVDDPSPNPLPQGGEGLSVLALSLWERVG